MYNIAKAVIISKRFELSDMLRKIDKLWLQGDLTDDKKSELETLARENALAENSYSVQEQLDSIFGNLSELDTKVRTIEDAVKVLQGGTVETPTPAEEWPEYVQPTGVHNAYRIGDKVSFNGKRYVCKLIRCVWSPETYPAGWEEIL